jgi:hypothetical protein
VLLRRRCGVCNSGIKESVSGKTAVVVVVEVVGGVAPVGEKADSASECAPIL